MSAIPIIDVFAGPGGLGEGFSSLVTKKEKNPFSILLSAEMDTYAHSTLRLRAYQRKILQLEKSTDHFKQYCLGVGKKPYTDETKHLWEKANEEALNIELGTHEGDSLLYRRLDAELADKDRWVLIGGPPCQAYSVAGRVRNKGKDKYNPLEDKRHFLYQEYLKIINRYRPAVFVMENVRGMLSCKIDGKLIAHQILQDLASGGTNASTTPSEGYRIYSLVAPECYEAGMNLKEINTSNFVVKTEEYGIPQARHRVILLGIRNDISAKPELLPKRMGPNVSNMIMDLPKLRSGFSRGGDSCRRWHEYVSQQMEDLAKCAQTDGQKKLARSLQKHAKTVVATQLSRKAFSQSRQTKVSTQIPEELKNWITGEWTNVYFNHETRGHMESDLRRYAFASAFTEVYEKSPKGAEDFSLPGLAPAHQNWNSGAFSDRFRVQQANRPATTITSHISKDGHYFIHPDPAQCRSFSVREAARIQTFPDDYFFCGPRTNQYIQVGNAVPPYLANQIAKIVLKLLQ
ncbi:MULTISPECIES: DNA cytosine methyltransferase [unclassified Maridesulfovibrio]|uniref:DNA cytosine methyltransferase n=1 Tax=unclassified Maridesulfovibrio TaxID=2794999 RepID=UPI003B3F49C8